MRRAIIFGIAILLGLGLLVLFSGGAIGGGQVTAQEAEEEEDEDEAITELDDVKQHIAELNLDEAEAALKAAKKELKSRKREKAVKKAIEAMENHIEALEEYEKAKEANENGKTAKALKSITKVIGKYGELYFAEQAEALYAELKKKSYYMINDFETEEFRKGEMYGTSRSGAKVELNDDHRFASDGRHSLKIHFDERAEGVKEQDPESYRAATLETPDGFSEELESLRMLTFSIFSYKRTNAKIDLVISGGGASAFAAHTGIALNFQGWKPYAVTLKQFKFNGSFQWRDARKLIFSTRGLLEVDFIIDDVKFHR